MEKDLKYPYDLKEVIANMNMMRNEPLFLVCLSQDNLYKLLFDTEKQDFDTTLEKPASENI